MKKLLFSILGLAIAASAYAVTPADPTNVSWYDSHKEDGFSRINYTLPQLDTEGNELPNLRNLGFRVFTDNDQLFTFEASVYEELYFDMTEIYYWVYGETGNNFNGDHTYFYRTNWEGYEPFFSWRIGIQAVYDDNGTKTYSNIVYTEVFPQETLPKPAKPGISEFIDFGAPIGIDFGYTITEDYDGNLVGDDYSPDKYFNGEEYSILDPEKVSFSVYTDNDQIFTFTPELFPSQLSEPTTQFPYTKRTPNGGVGYWDIHFDGLTNIVEEGQDPFFTWRIGIQTIYSDGVQSTASDIVYMEIYPQLQEAKEVTSTSFLADWSCDDENMLIINNFIGDGCGYFLYVIDKATQEVVLTQNVEPTNSTTGFWGNLVYLPGATYLVEGLTPGTTYEFYVDVVQNTGMSYQSVVREVTLPAAGLRGDVNMDKNITITDVTALINYLLSGDSTGISLENANCNLDDRVSITDVTALINYLLTGTWD